MSEFYKLQVAEVLPETDTAVEVVLDIPAALRPAFAFTQGQYLTLRQMLDGDEVRRSYSICSAVGDGRLSIGIRRVEGGRFSTFANTALKQGDTIEVMPPQGTFFTPLRPHEQRRFLCIAAGSGITPILSIIKTTLLEEPESEVTLIYGNQRTNTMMFREPLSDLKNRFLDRFQWINIMSREEHGADLLSGRINNKKGAQLQAAGLIDIKSYDHYFLCGPEAMISEVSRGLRAEGVDESVIHYELFGASAAAAAEAVEKHHQRAERFAGVTSAVSVVKGGRTIRMDVSADGENILDAAMGAGADLPYSCKGGVCATCKAKLVKGEVEMDLTHGLEPDEIEAGFILTCQSHPVSAEVVVDFDQR
ncbi:phenylacetate-CoA oxygenase/reductase subunit PaaK [Exilibacterium tricleocarpae]|uniref:Phenylacetate-CoA oxygenase/reductase subunit PaaK n=1 Tax=Exilibacterium tricleocarpae TaxID=2591008 RepID=A0A545SP13_9GAMM|nr:1,2-phenylacetyl-CoA epoxidase subunit PaaE [Exilibacterium tricleocarpae]TQV66723.1 phenylacetate-CoA oxygenase/reductase subunit PaaK [Exilibacterium tricleocarpae]